MKFDFDAKYFNPEHTLECGQVFRFTPVDGGYAVYSADKACLVTSDGKKTVVESNDSDYFWHYFDLDRDYRQIVDKAKSYNVPLLSRSAEFCKGLRILNQNREEMIYSFIISQNNNIPRIKGIINRICEGLGENIQTERGGYFSFPSSAAIAKADVSFFKNAGAGYRDIYLAETSKRLAAEGIAHLENLNAASLKCELLKYKGIGPKVADCIALFGFGKTDSFPVDTWIEKVYKEDFKGELKDRQKISDFLLNEFKEYSGYVQQYLFYGKRLNL
ncbi:MAG: 8-oxoguanine DNA glycosylase [Clostridia bacterium]|nr:8-oxoguanine DNA glycosylase [Clostridia bacterium]